MQTDTSLAVAESHITYEAEMKAYHIIMFN